MDYIWIILLAISAIIIAVYSKKVDKAEHPASYKKEGKKGKKETKKSKPKIKTREEYTDDGGDDFIDPNDNPERFIKLREQFIRENYK